MNKQDYSNIKAILDRGAGLYDRMSMMMDLEYVNDEIPLDFNKLLHFSEADFRHDIIGIYNNFSRNERKMLNLFVPRCAK